MPKFIADSSVRVLVIPLTYTGMKGEAYMKLGMLCPYCRRHLKAKSDVELVEVVQKHAEKKHAEMFEGFVRKCRDRDRRRFEGSHLTLFPIVKPLPGSEESIYATAL